MGWLGFVDVEFRHVQTSQQCRRACLTVWEGGMGSKEEKSCTYFVMNDGSIGSCGRYRIKRQALEQIFLRSNFL
jgi:hypothetical protein